jgi:thiol-disulfide isomerase/thioredoxin
MIVALWLFGVAFAPSTLTLAAPEPAGAGTPEVRLEVVKYDRLAEVVRAARGKVVVVDVWATYCLPCKKEFPNLVRLHQTYGSQGLVCLSVSVDTKSKEKIEAALQFLRKQGATFGNFLLDEEPEVWQKKWNVKGVPVVFVFDREGRRAAKFNADDPDHPFTYEDVEKLVKQLLAAHP